MAADIERRTDMNIENCTQEDFLQIREDIADFWGSDRTLYLHHHMFLYEFGDTAFVIRDKGQVIAYLFGFISQKNPSVGYIHLAAVRESHKGQGLGKRLYSHFAKVVQARGCSELKAITSPANTASIAFHKALGFESSPNAEGVSVIKDYSGRGNDRAVFQKDSKMRIIPRINSCPWINWQSVPFLMLMSMEG
ncbi:GNAT family N-acetyltransferase [Candidatus Woesearchaeota archaeon]|nr:GNAT family N-acetyltransferase [Candidatus Woesearchaeota archaeon]